MDKGSRKSMNNETSITESSRKYDFDIQTIHILFRDSTYLIAQVF